MLEADRHALSQLHGRFRFRAAPAVRIVRRACTVILVNRSPNEPVAATITLPSGPWRPGVHHHLDAASPTVVKTSAQRDAVRTRTTPSDPKEGQPTLVVPPAS